MIDIFSQGEPQTVITVLANKDWRKQQQQFLLRQNQHATLLSLKLNIPGSIKNNDYLSNLFVQGYQQISKQLKLANCIVIDKVLQIKRATGPEAILVIDTAGEQLKKISIQFEDESKLGRIFDVDVITQNNTQLSRTQLGYSPRSCYVCGANAKVCARSQCHSMQLIKNFLNKIYRDEISQNEIKNNC
ncbi:holo-ACP synthase CitX [Weissella beninensis]|uniref:citrate lyase holo-[acyl-carrier protein] synthase n=1 Tax=Periweissella beninensis TaxID=504936 RepID=A0ABT0VFI4_9LACO|nr:citrate lyase holo-[acyl-carrier protein] synthase [Periweissella beninensis]MBM7543627.1 holo-ACP synthase CitX [Periweissella beninensis]MCM2436607.1 citrate lyase holo-[acyl-carrier protein] synthase [Periweissella beninensis]